MGDGHVYESQLFKGLKKKLATSAVLFAALYFAPLYFTGHADLVLHPHMIAVILAYVASHHLRVTICRLHQLIVSAHICAVRAVRPPIFFVFAPLTNEHISHLYVFNSGVGLWFTQPQAGVDDASAHGDWTMLAITLGCSAAVISSVVRTRRSQFFCAQLDHVSHSLFTPFIACRSFSSPFSLNGDH
jgi:hypothetical protein